MHMQQRGVGVARAVRRYGMNGVVPFRIGASGKRSPPRVSFLGHRSSISAAFATAAHSTVASTPHATLLQTDAPAGSSNNGSAAPQQKNDLDFNDAGAAFRTKSLYELVRSYVVLRVCAFQPLVENSERLIGLSYSILGKQLTNFFVKQTFFAQFCAAEDEEGLKPVMSRLEASGISGILDYAAEADLEAHREERDLEVKVRVYEYEGEVQCDAATAVFEQCIRTAHNVAQLKGTGTRPFAAIKVTALGNPKLLKRISEMIRETKALFQRMEEDLERPTVGSISLDEWRRAYAKYFTAPEDPEAVDKLFFYALGRDKSDFDDAVDAADMATQQPRLDLVDWSRSMNMDVIAQLVGTCRERGPLSSVALSQEELELAHNLFGRLERLAKLAHELDVSLMIDAEQTYFQPCIDANVLGLQRIYNCEGKATIYNTYQCYLKSTDERVEQDLTRSKREGWKFAAKLVRGAYMVAERRLAKEEGYADPIHDSLQDTHACYNRNLERFLSDDEAEVMVASHNQHSCEFAVQKMRQYSIHQRDGRVHFGQLLGMADHLSYALGSHGYSAFKYLPYGQVHEVLPYLIRRAQENSGLIAGAVHERQLLLREIGSRLNPLTPNASQAETTQARL